LQIPYFRLQKENRALIEKVERLEEEYNKLRKASEFIMSIVECMDTEPTDPPTR
jgi:uncharacterized protein (UPF0335 family)